MLLGKLLALDLPLEHEGRIHQAIDHEQKTLLNHTHENPGMDLARAMSLLLPRAMDLSLLGLGLEIFFFVSESTYSTEATGSFAYIRDYAAGPGRGYTADSSAEATEPTA